MQPPGPKYRAVGFDLGDTLVFNRDTPLNWAALYPDALRAVAVVCGLTLSSQSLASAVQILSQYNTRIVPRAREVAATEIFSNILHSWKIAPAKHLSAGFLALASRLGLAPAEMLYVGNEPKDVVGAKGAGAIAIFLDRVHTRVNHGQDMTIPDLSALQHIVFDGDFDPKQSLSS